MPCKNGVVPDDYRYIRFTDLDKEVVRTISNILLEDLQQSPPSNQPAPDTLSISDESTARLLELLRQLVSDPTFQERTHFVESVSRANSFGNIKLARFYFASSRGLGLRSTDENVECAWHAFMQAYANISFQEFIAREGDLLAHLDVYPEVISLLIDFSFRFRKVIEDPDYRGSISRKGTILRTIDKTSQELDDRLREPRFGGWVSKTRIVAALQIAADNVALYAGAELSAVSLISQQTAAAMNLLLPDRRSD